VDLWNELVSKQKQLDASVRELRKSGTALAEAERTYKLKLREECLRLRGQEMPVTLIDKVCYGIPEVAELRFRRDCARVVYDANMDAINALKLEMRIISNQLQREWGQAGTGSM